MPAPTIVLARALDTRRIRATVTTATAAPATMPAASTTGSDNAALTSATCGISAITTR
jgi:hypothetical protein